MSLDHANQDLRIVDATLFYTAESGGVQTYLAAKAAWLAQQKTIKHFIVAPNGIESRTGARLVGVPSIPIPCARGYRMPLSSRIAADRIARLQPDLIEAGDPYHLAWSALRVKDRLGIPAVAFCHSDLPRLIERRFGRLAQSIARRYLQSLYSGFDLVLAPSRIITQQLRALGLARVLHQPLGVDTETFSPLRRKPGLRNLLGLPKDARLLIYAGRFTREKKLPLLLEAMQRLRDPYHLLMVGSGADFPAMPRVTCIPFQRNTQTLAEMIASCDALVHPGDQETFGLIVLEAMACGVPVVGMAAGGVNELIDDGTGIRVAPGSANALADGIHALYERDLEAMGRNARRKVMENYDWNRVIPQLIGRYADVLLARQRTTLKVKPLYAAE